jgi:hypothetical protein
MSDEDVRARIYLKVIVLLTLRVDVDKKLMQETLRLAVELTLAELGLERPAATTLGGILGSLITQEIKEDRNVLRTAVRSTTSHSACGNEGCAACRVRKWAAEEGGEPADADVEARIEEALASLRGGPKGPLN